MWRTKAFSTQWTLDCSSACFTFIDRLRVWHVFLFLLSLSDLGIIWKEWMDSSVCIKPQFTLTPSSSTKPLFDRFPWVVSCEPPAEVFVAKIRTHYYLDWFAKCFLDVSQTHVYTHISFSKGTLWKLNCVPFSKYWPQPLAMHVLPFLRGVVTSSCIWVVIL